MHTVFRSLTRQHDFVARQKYNNPLPRFSLVGWALSLMIKTFSGTFGKQVGISDYGWHFVRILCRTMIMVLVFTSILVQLTGWSTMDNSAIPVYTPLSSCTGVHLTSNGFPLSLAHSCRFGISFSGSYLFLVWNLKRNTVMKQVASRYLCKYSHLFCGCYILRYWLNDPARTTVLLLALMNKSRGHLMNNLLLVDDGNRGY